MCVVIPFILDVRFVDVPAGVTQEEGHTGFLHLPSAVFALIFLARRIQPFLSLVDREVDFFFALTPVAPVAQRYHVTSDTLGREFDPGKRDFLTEKQKNGNKNSQRVEND